MVVKVTDKEISTKALKNGGEVSSMPYGMLVWSTGIGARPVIMDFMKQLNQVYFPRFQLSIYYWTFKCTKNSTDIEPCASFNYALSRFQALILKAHEI